MKPVLRVVFISFVSIFLFAACGEANSAGSGSDHPAALLALERQGITIEDSFDAPDGLTGYAAIYQGQPLAIYATSSGGYVLVGTLLDASGNDVGEPALQKLVSTPRNDNAWNQLEKLEWVRDGNENAEHVVYMFSDPNCPYCHKFWEQSQPWVKAGKVQVRHVLVGLLKPTSLPKAAAIMAAEDPSEALDYSERHYEDGGIDVLDKVPEEISQKVAKNTKAMMSLGFYATPTIFYKDANGKAAMIQGSPRSQEQLEAVMGSQLPKY